MNIQYFPLPTGVTHRDLKLENILLSEDDQPIVTDFGFARYVGSTKDRRTRSTTFCGSYAYVAPEILQGTYMTTKLHTKFVIKTEAENWVNKKLFKLRVEYHCKNRKRSMLLDVGSKKIVISQNR